jgi:hypothetical protein
MTSWKEAQWVRSLLCTQQDRSVGVNAMDHLKDWDIFCKYPDHLIGKKMCVSFVCLFLYSFSFFFIYFFKILLSS